MREQMWPSGFAMFLREANWSAKLNAWGDGPSSCHCVSPLWGRHGITVNAVAPTFIRTPGTEEYLSVPQNRADVLERIAALHRIGEPMEVAGAVVFLASPAASLITGETILIDGGWTAR